MTGQLLESEGLPNPGAAMTVVVVGAGGHARVVAATIRSFGGRVHGFLDPQRPVGTQVLSAPVLGGDDWLTSREAAALRDAGWGLVNGLGANPHTPPRRALFERMRAVWPFLPTVVHPMAVVAEDAVIGTGSQILAGAVVQVNVHAADNVVVNTGAVVEHDCHLGQSSFIAPRATLCGGVQVGAGAFLGTGSIILPGVTIGREAVVGAGAVVIRDVPPGCRVLGVPARGARRAHHRSASGSGL